MADSEVREGSGQARDAEEVVPDAQEQAVAVDVVVVAAAGNPPKAKVPKKYKGLKQNNRRRWSRNNSTKAPKTNKAAYDAYQAQNPQVPEDTTQAQATTATTKKQTKAQKIRSQASKITHLENSVEVLTYKVTKHEKNEVRMMKRIKNLQLDKKNISTILANQKKASKILMQQQMNVVGALHVKMKKLESDAALGIEQASLAILEQRRVAVDQVREERRKNSRAHSRQKAKLEKEMERVVDRYDSALDEWRKKFEKEKDVYTRSLNKAGGKIAEERQYYMRLRDQALEQVHQSRMAVSEEKKNHRDAIQKQLDRLCDAEKKVKEYKNHLADLRLQLAVANHEHELEQVDADKKLGRVRKLANDRKRKSELLKAEVGELKDKNAELSHELVARNRLIEEFKIQSEGRLVLKKVSRKGGGRGGLSWERPVVQLICELLVIGVIPSQIRETLGTVYEHMYGKTTDDLPSVDFIRKQRIVVQVLAETMSAMRLASAPKWDQGHLDATSRGQSEFEAFIVGVLDDDLVMEHITVSACIILEDGTAECTANSMFNKVCQVIQ